MGNSFRIIFIKINIFKNNSIKIYTKNTHFTNKKCGVIRIFINKDYIITNEKRISKFLIILFVTNQFNAGRKLSTTLSHISLVLYQSGTESNTKEQVSEALTHIF